MIEYTKHDITHSTGFKTPISFDRFFIVNEQTRQYDFQNSIAPHNPIIIGDATNYLFVNENLAAGIKYVGDKSVIIGETNTTSLLRVEGGKNWHQFVMEMLQAGLFNLENLALIPGTVGAAPVQNIGAYGREVSESIKSVQCIKISTGELFQLSAEECLFTYRHSIFKEPEYSDVLISHVVFELSKNQNPVANYPDVQAYLDMQNVKNPSSHDIAEAIIAIRRQKLPDPQIIGNAGSFFKNPIIDAKQFNDLQRTHPSLPSYFIDEIKVKIPAGWLIDTCGFKGFRYQGAGVHDRQALVLINADKAIGKDIYELALMIQQKVLSVFGIKLEPEVNILL